MKSIISLMTAIILICSAGKLSAQYEAQHLGKTKNQIINTFGSKYDITGNEIVYWQPNQYSERYVFRFRDGKCNEIVIYYNSCSYAEAKSQFEWLLNNYLKFGWYEKNWDASYAYWRRVCDSNFNCATITVASSGNGGVIFQVMSITN